MQPARDEVVQNLTVPASAASASARRGAMMSLPSWLPCPRGSPKSSVYDAAPSTGKTSRGTPPDGDAAAAPAPRSIAVTARRIPRAVFRRGVIKSGSRSKRGSLAGSPADFRPKRGKTRAPRPCVVPGEPGRPRLDRVPRDEDRRLRERGARRDRPQADRPGHEAARPLRRGGAERLRRERGRGGAAAEGRDGRGRGRRPLDGPRARAQLAAQGARDGRRPRGPRHRRRRRRLRPRRHERRARAGARARGGRPRALRPAVVRLRRRRPLGGRRRAAAAPGHLAGRRADARRRLADRASARPSSATTSSARRCRPSSRSPTRSTSRATRR